MAETAGIRVRLWFLPKMRRSLPVAPPPAPAIAGSYPRGADVSARQRDLASAAAPGLCRRRIALVTALALFAWSASQVPLSARDEVAETRSGATAGALSEFVDSLGARAATLRPEVLGLALEARACAARQGLVADTRLLTVIDYSLPSTEPRLWVLDVPSRRVVFAERVAHGRNSGDDRATRFSNNPGSLQSSLGLFVTDTTYVGRNGYSLRLHGLELGVNDRAFERAIVMHGAPYVSDAAARVLGRLGRSWGCPALATTVAREVIDLIKGGSALFAYYPDANWLDTSRFAGRCITSR